MRRVRMSGVVTAVGLLALIVGVVSGCSLLGAGSRPTGGGSVAASANPSASGGPVPSPSEPSPSEPSPPEPGSSSARPVPSTTMELPSPSARPSAQPSSSAASAGSSAPSSSAPSSAISGAPTTYQQAAARIAAARAASPSPDFSTPSGNIYCSLTGAVVGCELAEGRPPAPTDYCSAGGDAGARDIGRIELQQGRATPVCNSDTIVTPGAPTLAYGSSVGAGSVRCVSEEIGVTCVDANAEHGFFLARGRYLLF